jgi:hypothetical protein
MNKLELNNFSNYFLDFDPQKFEKQQAKMIFEEIGVLLEKRDYQSAKKHCNEIILNVFFFLYIINIQ